MWEVVKVDLNFEINYFYIGGVIENNILAVFGGSNVRGIFDMIIIYLYTYIYIYIYKYFIHIYFTYYVHIKV